MSFKLLEPYSKFLHEIDVGRFSICGSYSTINNCNEMILHHSFLTERERERERDDQ
jgi:hypothetical protein